RRIHGSFYVVSRRYSAVGWIFRKILFVQRCATRWCKSHASVARGPWPRRQFRLAVLLPPCFESDFRRRPVARSRATYGSRTIRFFTASYSRSACRSSCFPRGNAERFGVTHSGRNPVRIFKKMQLTLDRRAVSFASKVGVPM